MNSYHKPLKKSSALARLEQLRTVVEDEELQQIHKLAVIDTLLDYIHDADIRNKVEEIAL